MSVHTIINEVMTVVEVEKRIAFCDGGEGGAAAGDWCIIYGGDGDGGSDSRRIGVTVIDDPGDGAIGGVGVIGRVVVGD